MKEGADKELQRQMSHICLHFAGCLLQTVSRCIAELLQGVFRLPSVIHISTFLVILCRFHAISAVRKKRVTDGRTDGRADPHIEMPGRI